MGLFDILRKQLASPHLDIPCPGLRGLGIEPIRAYVDQHPAQCPQHDCTGVADHESAGPLPGADCAGGQTRIARRAAYPHRRGVTGLLFGIHPLHVESVAWVAERKDLLSGLFFLLSIMMYLKYCGRVPIAQCTGHRPRRKRQYANRRAQRAWHKGGFCLLLRAPCSTLYASLCSP